MNLIEITLDQHMDMIEYAGNTLDKHDLIDSSAPSLVEVCSSFSTIETKTLKFIIAFFRFVVAGYGH